METRLRRKSAMTPAHQSNIVRDMLNTQLPPDTIALWWLGQAGFVLRSSRSIVYLDPFLSDRPARLIPPLFAAESGPPADLVLCTHEHWDHLDPQTLSGLAQASPQARFVVPLPIVEQVTALGIAPERVIGVQPDEERDLGATALISSRIMTSDSTVILAMSLRWPECGCMLLAIQLSSTA